MVTTCNGTSQPIRRRSTGSETVMTAPLTGQPTAKKEWTHLAVHQLILWYSSINRGIQNYYRFTDNLSYLSRIQYILKFSLAQTLAAKFKCSLRHIFQRFGAIPTIQIKDGNQERQITFYHNSDWKKQRNGFPKGHAPVDLLQESIRLRSRSKLGMPCCICNTSNQVEMHLKPNLSCCVFCISGSNNWVLNIPTRPSA